MHTALLLLHVISALGLWIFTLYAFKLPDQNPKLKKVHSVRKQLLVAILFVAVLGVGLSLLSSSSLIMLCTRLGLYISPVLISLMRLTMYARRKNQVPNEH